ncbi:MAG TPA: bifunctional GNAT family N-acetyltransferase/(deoxy)nucleoside triphosphate pyrophosphohydrolase [Acetobacteraceae bacterium]|nr:bifunctional GNAT family N-acetyltransferase/(deoxy)nucleoside triphosphate pyrophosphohydrolase [Acetobacteraceae bacterium]
MTSAGKAQPRTARRRKSARTADLPLEPPPDLPPEQPDFVPLATERLVLRPLRPADAESVFRLASDWEVTRMLAMVPCPYPRDLADRWVVSTGEQLTQGTAYHLAITGQEVDQEVLVGVVGLQIDRTTRTGHLGYWVGRRFWGLGVATEAAGKMVRWGFANLDLDRIGADVATDNPASAAVLRRIGFRQTSEGEEHFESRKAQHPVWRFEATRDDVFGHPDPGPAGNAETEPGAKPLLLVAACALVDVDGRVLLARRPEGKAMAGLWEFPGGKLHPGETPEAALIRELREELGIDVTAACLAPFAFASHEYQRFHLLMPLFLCRRWKGIPTAREHQTLAWVRPQRLAEYEMPPADKPLIPLLRDFL